MPVTRRRCTQTANAVSTCSWTTAEKRASNRKGFQMTRDEQLRATVKRHGNVIGLAKFICSQGTTDITEHELTALVVDAAKREHPDNSDAQAFAKAFGAAGPN